MSDLPTNKTGLTDHRGVPIKPTLVPKIRMPMRVRQYLLRKESTKSQRQYD